MKIMVIVIQKQTKQCLKHTDIMPPISAPPKQPFDQKMGFSKIFYITSQITKQFYFRKKDDAVFLNPILSSLTE